MGAFAARPFKPTNDIVGQGGIVIRVAKRLKITKYELDRVFHEFLKHEDRFSHLVTISTMFQRLKVEYSLFMQVVFQLYDLQKSGVLNFLEFLVIVWAFLSLNDDGLAVLCFTLFDVERYNAMDISEAKYLVNLVWNFKISSSVQRALNKLDKNQDAVITMDEFVVLCRHHSNLLSPIKTIQSKLRKKLVYSRFWKELSVRRISYFGLKSIVQLRALDGANVVACSMEYLNLRKEIVPQHFVEQWKIVQRKRNQSYKGHIEMPHELREKMRQNPASSSVDLRDIWDIGEDLQEGSSELFEDSSSYVI